MFFGWDFELQKNTDCFGQEQNQERFWTVFLRDEAPAANGEKQQAERRNPVAESC